MSKLTFSISVPVYKQAQFVATALESIRCQTVSYELAVLDATPDKSAQNIIDQYSDIIHYRYHHADEGQTAAIMEGWENTSGDIVAWLNADDYYYPDALSKVEKIFLENTSIDVVYGHSAYVTAENQFQMYFPAIQNNPSMITKGCTISQPSCFVRRKAMERIGGLNKDLHYTMDWDFWIRLYSANCSFYFLDELLSAVIIHAATKTQSGASRRFEEIDYLLSKNCNWLQRKLSLTGFRLHDLLFNVNERSFIKSILLNLRQFRRSNVQHGVINGLECHTNLVKNHCCVIQLPWFSNKKINEVKIIVDKPSNYSLKIEDKTIEMKACSHKSTQFSGEFFQGLLYHGILPPLCHNTISIELTSPEKLWKLLGAEFFTN